MKRLWLVVSLLGLAGCSMFTAHAPLPVLETSPSVVAACRKVATIPGPSGFRLWGPPATLGSFKYEAALKAKKMGATHIYWREDLEGLEGRIVGYAVDCTGIDVDTDKDEFLEE